MAKAKVRSRLETGMLSFARSLQPSEGLFWGTRSGNGEWKEPVEVFEKGVRGQSSEYKTENPGKSNPQVVDAAVVPPGCDGVRLDFSMWVLPHTREPWACDKPEVARAYRELVEQYADKGGFDVLARRYLWNIANARFAWRNRFQSDDMRVEVEFDGRKITFDPSPERGLDLIRPASVEQLRAAALSNEPAPIEDLIALIARGLRTEKTQLNITWHARMEEAQEIFPSQEYLREEKAKNAPSRVYARLLQFWNGRVVNQASMHSQKIGAALRHIDVVDGRQNSGVIAVNPYGGVQETGAVLRVDKKRGGEDRAPSFYVLRSDDNALFTAIETAKSAEDIHSDVHYVIANLVRGGVFGQKGGADA